jgi:hypothetical protein
MNSFLILSIFAVLSSLSDASSLAGSKPYFTSLLKVALSNGELGSLDLLSGSRCGKKSNEACAVVRAFGRVSVLVETPLRRP